MNRFWMIWTILFVYWTAEGVAANDSPGATADHASAAETPDLIVVVGASGAEEYRVPFREAAERWQEAGSAANASIQIIGHTASDGTAEHDNDAKNDYARIHAAVNRLNIATDQPLWIALIGHGTYADNIAKFNLTGPDFSAREMAAWLEDYQRPVIFINGASASGPFINRLSAPGRIIVTATQSGGEQNYARFGEYFAKSIGNLEADIDHDDAVSVLEAFLHAAAATQQFYETEGRLATEHALIDDNGDEMGTPADFFRGVRAIKSPGSDAEVDGEFARQFSLLVREDVPPLTAQQREQRDQLERQLRELRDQKDTLSEDAYFDAFHGLAVQLAKIYRDAEDSQPRQADDQEDDEREEGEPTGL